MQNNNTKSGFKMKATKRIDIFRTLDFLQKTDATYKFRLKDTDIYLYVFESGATPSNTGPSTVIAYILDLEPISFEDAFKQCSADIQYKLSFNLDLFI